MTKDQLQRYLPLKRESALRNGLRAEELTAIESAVDGLEDPTDRMVLRLRYIEGKSWIQVSHAIYYSRSQTMRIHARALARLEAGGHSASSF